MTAASITDQKDRLRKLLYKRRAEAARGDSGSAGMALAARVTDELADRLDGGLAGQIVSAFLPIRTEIDTRALIDRLVSAGATVVLPAIVENNPDLVFRVWVPGDPLSRGAFGVDEPLPSSAGQDPTALVIPLLAFDRAGYRLGYGGGYYDRAITRLRARHQIRAIGIAYDAQEVVHIPREPHDQKLDAIATPTRVIKPEG